MWAGDHTVGFLYAQKLKAKCAIKVVCGAITGLSLKLACYDINVDGGDSESAECIGSEADQYRLHVCKLSH